MVQEKWQKNALVFKDEAEVLISELYELIGALKDYINKGLEKDSNVRSFYEQKVQSYYEFLEILKDIMWWFFI